MNTLGARLRIIPRTAWFIAVLVYVGFVLFAVSVPMRHDPQMRDWPLATKAAFTGLMPLLLFVYVLLIGFVHADAKRRGMRYVMWTWLAVLVPNAIGIILYFLLRDPLPRPCPNCQTVLPARFTFCPHCGTATTRICPNCGKPAERGWVNCAFCGTKLPGNGQKMEIGK
jgi:hypothetical protein